MLRQAEESAQSLVVALVSGGAARVVERLSFDEDEPVEVEQGIIEQGLTLQGEDSVGLLCCSAVAALEGFCDLGQASFVIIEVTEVFCACAVLVRKGPG